MKEIVIKLSDEIYEGIYAAQKLAHDHNFPESTELAGICYKAIYDGTVLPEEHGDLIDRTKLYEQTAEWEAEALTAVNKYIPSDSPDEWRWWSAVLKERTAFKYDVADAPTVIEADEGDDDR